jgi:sortase A
MKLASVADFGAERRTAARVRWRPTALIVGATLAAIGLGGAGYMDAKAVLAQLLLRSAWQRNLETGLPAKPWPWADTRAVARLRVPRLDIDQIVLTGASGRSLAFGPALSSGAAAPGTIGNAIISGHRDTHFRFLAQLQPGDRIWLDTARGPHAYVVTAAEVVDSRYSELRTQSDAMRLTLVTCYPFNTVVPGGPLRYVVSAVGQGAGQPLGANEGPAITSKKRARRVLDFS